MRDKSESRPQKLCNTKYFISSIIVPKKFYKFLFPVYIL